MSNRDLELRVAWQRHLGATENAWACFESVVARYREPHRHHHDVRHLRWVVRHTGELGRDLDSLAEVMAAAFFHDAVYDPTRNGNEAASASLAATALDELGWERPRVDVVADLVTGTVDHIVTGATPEESVLFAADLAVLATEPSAYADYVRNVRREYAHVDDETWVTGRSAVLDAFLERPAIYAPDLGLDHWEARARANLTAERSALGGTG